MSTKEWLLNRHSEFVSADSVFLENLSGVYNIETKEAKVLLELLKIKNKPINEELVQRKNAAEVLGISTELVDILKETKEQGLSDEEIVVFLQKKIKSKKPVFPDAVSPNAEIRESKIKEEYDNAEVKRYEEKSRSVRVSGSHINSNAYLNTITLMKMKRWFVKYVKKKCRLRKRMVSTILRVLNFLTKIYLTRNMN